MRENLKMLVNLLAKVNIPQDPGDRTFSIASASLRNV